MMSTRKHEVQLRWGSVFFVVIGRHFAANFAKSLMSLYVLIERGPQVVSQTFTGTVLEFFQTAFPLPGAEGSMPHVALFLSPIDAALCRTYMNTRPRPGECNRYEIARHDSSEVMNALSYLMQQGARICLILGFSTDAAGRLVLSDGGYSLCPWTLTRSDWNCLQGAGSKPASAVLDKAFDVLAKHGAPNHQHDIQRLEHEDSKVIQKMAELALAQVGAVMNGQDGGFSIFLPSQARWSKLV